MYMYMYAASVLGCLVLDLNHRGTCHHPYSKNNYSNYRFFPSSDIRSMLHCKTKKKQVNFGLSRRGSPFRSQVVSYHINHTKKILESYGFLPPSTVEEAASFYRVDGTWHKPPAPPEVGKHYVSHALVSWMACLCGKKWMWKVERLFLIMWKR